VVDASGGAQYTEIQPAVDAASPGDTIEVRSGAYGGGSGDYVVTLDKNVTLVAPQGAAINASGRTGGLSTGGIEVVGNAAPTIEGFTIFLGSSDSLAVGVKARETSGVWTVRDVTISYCRNDESVQGIQARSSSGDWVIRNVSTLREGPGCTAISRGVNAPDTSGDWVIDGLTVPNATFTGVLPANTSGSWTIRNATILNTDIGIGPIYGTADWQMENVTLRNHANTGIRIRTAEGDWSIVNSTIRNNGFSAVSIENATGAWEVRESAITDHERSGLTVARSAMTGDATCNWWGASDGPGGDFPGSGNNATGNVTVEPYYTDAAMTTLSNGTGSPCENVGVIGSGSDGEGDGAEDGDDSDGGSGQSPVEQYENANGVVNTDGLRSAIGDWTNGTLTTEHLIRVLTAWSSGG